MATTDTVTGYIIAKIAAGPVIDPAIIVIGIVLAGVVLGVGFFLCWDLGKQTVSDLAKIGWIIIFFLLPLYSWIAYWLLIRKS